MMSEGVGLRVCGLELLFGVYGSGLQALARFYDS